MSSCEICPNCNDAYLIERGKYSYCTDSKFCKYKERVKPLCQYCNQKLTYDRKNCIGYCPNHLNFTIELCPNCHGFMQSTKKKNLFGCSEFCGYMRNESN